MAEIDGLTWLPERGMGHYPVTAPDEEVYDAAYFERYLGYDRSEMGRRLTSARLALVRRHWQGPLVDIGVGGGAFVLVAGPCARGYDVNPFATRWLLRHGLWCDPYLRQVPALTCWDSLEHVVEPARLVACARRWLFLSLPIVPGDGPPSPEWRHFRPTEHRWYWTRRGLIDWMGELGFELAELSFKETDLGRQNIEAFAFRRTGAPRG